MTTEFLAENGYWFVCCLFAFGSHVNRNTQLGFTWGYANVGALLKIASDWARLC